VPAVLLLAPAATLCNAVSAKPSSPSTSSNKTSAG
jgi:hypothetical protein